VSFQLPAGPLKRIFIDREAARYGHPAWVIQVGGHEYPVRSFTILTDAGHSAVEAKGSVAAPLSPVGPAFWLETTAEVEIP
jgi:hypothetical protein